MTRCWLLVGLALSVLLILPGCGDRSLALSPEPDASADRKLSLSPLDGAALFRIACAGCHRVEPGGAHDVGPNLHGIVGQPAASRPDYAYSAALIDSNLSWDRSTLAAWIAATEVLVPGTSMSYANILNGDEVARLIDHLLDTAEAGKPLPAP